MKWYNKTTPSIAEPAHTTPQNTMTEWQGYYSAAQVSRLARVPMSTIYYWKAKGIIMPSVVLKRDDLVVDYGYSYANLTVIRLMRAIRDKRLNLRSVSIALHHRFERFGPPSKGWADAQVFIVGGHVFAEKRVLDAWGTPTAEKYGQRVETRLFGDLFDELRGMEEGGSILVPKEFSSAVEIDPNIMNGEPVVRDTRIATSVLFIKYLKGKTIGELAKLFKLAKGVVKKVIEYEQFLSAPIPTARQGLDNFLVSNIPSL